MFNSAHTERGLLVSGESYTVDVSYGLWLPLVFLLGKVSRRNNCLFPQGSNNNRILNVCFRHISRNILLESLRCYGDPASYKNFANLSLCELNGTYQLFYSVKPPIPHALNEYNKQSQRLTIV